MAFLILALLIVTAAANIMKLNAIKLPAETLQQKSRFVFSDGGSTTTLKNATIYFDFMIRPKNYESMLAEENGFSVPLSNKNINQILRSPSKKIRFYAITCESSVANLVF